MTALVEKIYNEVLDLPNDERLSLIDKLLHVVSVPPPTHIEQAWLKESHRRLDEIQSGKSKTIPAADLFQEINERLHQ